MSGMELDRQLREILMAVTRETALSAVASIVILGFPARAAFALVSDTLEARDGQEP